MEKQNKSYKVILLGDSGVGKTSIISNYLYNEIDKDHISTFSITYQEINLNINNTKVVLDIWDTLGQENFLSLNKMFFREAEVAVLVYDKTVAKSYQNLKDIWYKSIIEECGKDKISKFKIILNSLSCCGK